jgi:hypothetical protein
LVLLFAGCAAREETIATNAVYDILRRGDQYSIRLHKNNGYSMGYGITDLAMIEKDPFRYFTDLQSMKRAVLEGDFTPSEIKYATLAEENSKIDTDEGLIFNPYQLYQPYVPEGSRVCEKIQWRFWAYDFALDLEGPGTGGCVVLHEKGYLEQVSAFDDEIAEIKASARNYIVEEVEDPETGELLLVDTSDKGVREAFAEKAAQEAAALLRFFNRNGIDHLELSTDKPYINAVRALFQRRARKR